MVKSALFAGVVAMMAAPAFAQTPSQVFGPDRDECTAGIAATAGHDLFGRNTVAGRPYDSEKPHCNVVVTKDGQVRNFTVSSLIGLFFADKPKPTEQAAKPVEPVKDKRG